MDKQVTDDEFAEHMGVGRTQVQYWIKDGLPKDEGKLWLNKGCQWVRTHKESKRQEKLVLLEEQARNTSAQADLRELELAEARGEIIKTSEFELLWERAAVSVKNKLLMLPTKLSARIVGKTNINEVKDLIDEDIRSALTELSTRGYIPVAIKVVHAPAKTNGKPVGRPKKKVIAGSIG